VELPNQQGLNTLAPEKNLARTEEAMGHIRGKIGKRYAEKRKPDAPNPPLFATDQNTQMLVGADPSKDATILGCADQPSEMPALFVPEDDLVGESDF